MSTTPSVHWSARRANRLTDQDLREALVWAERYAVRYARERPGIDELELRSLCARGAWYAYCSYREDAPFDWPTHYRWTVRRWALRIHLGEVPAEQRPLRLGEPLPPGYSEPTWDPRPQQDVRELWAAISLLPPREQSVVERTLEGYSSREFQQDRTTVQRVRQSAFAWLRELLTGARPWRPWSGPLDDPAAQVFRTLDEPRPLVQCAAGGCNERVPEDGRSDQRYCSERCKKRTQQRAYRARRRLKLQGVHG